jgi:hypothetical protein
MRRRVFITHLSAAAAGLPFAARAQQAGKINRIGFLGLASATRRLPVRPSVWTQYHGTV